MSGADAASLVFRQRDVVLNGLLMAFALHRYLTGIMFIAIGVGFVVIRRYRLRRDQARTFD